MSHENERCREVSRRGVVTAVHGTVVDIQIVQRSACSACHIKAICAAGEAAEKTVQAPNDGTLVPGMAVTLSMDERIGWLGVLVGFVLPLVLVVTLLFSLRGILPREEVAGLIAVASLVPYYGVVHLFRGFFSRVVKFRVTPEANSVQGSIPGLHPFQFVRKEGTL